MRITPRYIHELGRRAYHLHINGTTKPLARILELLMIGSDDRTLAYSGRIVLKVQWTYTRKKIREVTIVS